MKKVLAAIIGLFLLLIVWVPSAHARSYSIDSAHIRAWILPNGDLVVNEKFLYTFEGDYSKVTRSIHEDHHDGIIDLEAFELLDPAAVPGFVEKNDLRPLTISHNGNTYTAEITASDEEKAVFYIYILKNAVKSYDTYSDLTIPFFGTGDNHDKDLHNVTIDIVFPSEVDTSDYHAYFHDLKGGIEDSNSELVRFYTPLSERFTLTEPRLLFPSSIMTEQAKTKEPVPLSDVLAQEEKKAEASGSVMESRKLFSAMLTLLAVILAAASLVTLLMLRLRRGGYDGRLEEFFQKDPLYLYVVDRLGKRDHYSVIAGLYSLVDKGSAKMRIGLTPNRMQFEEGAPKNTLNFTIQPDEFQKLNRCEKIFTSWLFRMRRKSDVRFFTMNSLYGATKSEQKNNSPLLYDYRDKYRDYKEKEKEWFDGVLKEMTSENDLNPRWLQTVGRWLMGAVILSIHISFILDSQPLISHGVYLVFWAIMAKMTWSKMDRRMAVPIFYLGSLFAIGAVSGTDMFRGQTNFLFMAYLLYALTPRMVLSPEAAYVRAQTKHFNRLVKREGLPDHLSDRDLEKWMSRAVILRAKKLAVSQSMSDRPAPEFAAAAPLAFLVLSGEEPGRYLFDTWKWSTVPSSSSGSGGGIFGDSSGGGDSGGGDGGGGAGAD